MAKNVNQLLAGDTFSRFLLFFYAARAWAEGHSTVLVDNERLEDCRKTGSDY